MQPSPAGPEDAQARFDERDDGHVTNSSSSHLSMLVRSVPTRPPIVK